MKEERKQTERANEMMGGLANKVNTFLFFSHFAHFVARMLVFQKARSLTSAAVSNTSNFVKKSLLFTAHR